MWQHHPFWNDGWWASLPTTTTTWRRRRVVIQPLAGTTNRPTAYYDYDLEETMGGVPQHLTGTTRSRCQEGPPVNPTGSLLETRWEDHGEAWHDGSLNRSPWEEEFAMYCIYYFLVCILLFSGWDGRNLQGEKLKTKYSLHPNYENIPCFI